MPYNIHLKWLSVFRCFYKRLTTYKNSSSYLSLFVRYCDLKNDAFWLVKSSLDHYSRTRLFSKMQYLQKVRRLLVLSFSSKKNQMNWSDFCHRPKKPLNFGPSWPIKAFSQKSSIVTFLILLFSNHAKKSELMSYF